MKDFIRMRGQCRLVGYIQGAIWRRLRTMTFGALVGLLFAPHGGWAYGAATELSPMVARSTLVSSLDPAKEISVILSLPLGDAQGAADFVQHVSKPGDQLFRKYISPDEFAARFGANASDFAVLKEWATANHLTIVQEGLARTLLTVRGTVAQFQTLFKTELANYRSPRGDQFYSAKIAPTIPDAIASKVSGVIGLTGSIQYAPLAKIAKVFGEDASAKIGPDSAGGTGPGGAFAPKDLRTAYQIPSYGGVVPQTIAIFEQGGFFASDIKKFIETMKLPEVPVKFVSVNDYNGTVDDTGIELEAVLDIDTVIGINPHAKEVLVYEDGTDTFQVALLDALEKVATDHLAQTLSISYGLDEVQQGDAQLAAENSVLEQLAAEGITVLVSSGDDGAYGRSGASYSPAQLEAPDPGSQPLVTCVGGTTLSTGPNQQYSGEEVWNRLAIGHGATGGGVSSYWPIPSYQPAWYVTSNGGSSTLRNVPDIAAVGDPLTGVAVYSKINGGWLQIGGTSVSAPLWAGYVSVMNAGLQYLVNRGIGFFNPILYGIGNPAGYLNPVGDGSNGNVQLYGTPGYNAGYGYNNCCGSGTPWAGNFAFQVLTSETGATPPPGFTFTRNTVTTTTATVEWTAATGATGYVLGLFHAWESSNISAGFITKDTKYTFTGLLPKTEYYLYVGAVNAGGSSEEITFITTK